MQRIASVHRGIISLAKNASSLFLSALFDKKSVLIVVRILRWMLGFLALAVQAGYCFIIMKVKFGSYNLKDVTCGG